MNFNSVTFANFRSYLKDSFTFSPSITVIIGDNAKGKTNILEAIYALSTGKSFRAQRDREMIYFDKEISRLKGQLKNKSGEISLEIVITSGEVMGVKTPNKKYLVQGVGKRMSDFVGNLRCVLFWPQDLELVTSTPSLRRKYFDFVLTSVDREYTRTLLSYEKGLRRRNKLLEAIRDEGASRNQLLFWNQLLVKQGSFISAKRREFINSINEFVFDKSYKIQSEFCLKYLDSEISEQRLEKYRMEEVSAAATLVGPHRDDIIFKIKNQNAKINDVDDEYRDLSSYGSRGEQRLSVLWLKLAELEYIKKESDETPVLLLDDIFSELDKHHRKIIFDIVTKQQTIITTTELDFISSNKLVDLKMINL